MDEFDVEREMRNPKSDPAVLHGEVRVIFMILAAWLVVILGSQFAIWYLEKNMVDYWLSEIIFFNLPIHFWLSGQFLPLWFILLSIAFNLWMDRHESRKFESTIRYRGVGRSKKEQQS